MLWALWSLGVAVLYGVASQLNHYWRLPGRLLIRWRNLVPAACVLPLVFLFPPPIDPIFYLAAFISSVFVPWHDVRMFDMVSHHNGAVILRLRSLVLPLIFLAWMVIDPAYTRELFAHPLLGGGILLCVLLSSFFLFQLKHCAITKAAMRGMIPVILMGVVFDIMNKIAMDHAPFPSNMVYYIFLVSGLPLFYGLFAQGGKTRKFVSEMEGISRQGSLLGFLWVIMMAGKNLGMMMTPNPAYVTAVTLTAPFWTSLFMRLRGEKEEADWISGTGMVSSIIALAVLSSFVPH